MFGYVMPLKPELKIREFEVFKSYYCGLCTQIGKKSYVSKLTLTYDMAFLSLLLSSIYQDREFMQRKLCPFKMKKVNVVPSSEFMEYCGDMNIILSNRKLLDNYHDDKNIFALAASKFIGTRRLSELSKYKVEKIDYWLFELNKLEKNKCSSIDEIGHCFGELTSEIFAVYDDKNKTVLKTIGYNLGKWIYTLDAYDDLEKDIKKKKYNPFVYGFKYSGEEPKAFRDSIKDNIQFVLIRCLDEISKAFELLDIKKNRGIIENIVYMGMERKTMKVIERSCYNE